MTASYVNIDGVVNANPGLHQLNNGKLVSNADLLAKLSGEKFSHCTMFEVVQREIARERKFKPRYSKSCNVLKHTRVFPREEAMQGSRGLNELLMMFDND